MPSRFLSVVVKNMRHQVVFACETVGNVALQCSWHVLRRTKCAMLGPTSVLAQTGLPQHAVAGCNIGVVQIHVRALF